MSLMNLLIKEIITSKKLCLGRLIHLH